MTHDYNIPHTAKASALHRVLLLVICFILSSTTTSIAQTIGGNVYGAGNQGNVGSSSTVTLKGGTIMGDVYGGAREANVAGRTFVDVNATNALLVRGVYGGNDVSGTIGKSDALPFTPILSTGITTDWNSFVRIANNTHPVIIGSLYGGGNGAYTYDDENKKPVLDKTYLEIQGGIFGNIYGGGNNATVTENTVIYMNNQLANLTVSSATLGNFLTLFDDADYTTNGDNITFSHHVSRMFGGNNLAEMAIRPTWHLQGGIINNLYSGGNRGAMTSPTGILLPLTSANLTVNNVYGGCRIADVDPGTNAPGEDKTIQDYTFPAGYATRVYITAGNITNVYGGNDISGKVHYGTNLAIFSNITGDVYGGGNGSYAYTDRVTTSDYYYTLGDGESSIKALFDFRPHIEKTLIHVAGNDAAPISLGNVYCGGNSATIYKEDGLGAATFRIGKNITIGNVFLGSNGENMVTRDMLSQYANNDYNTITLTDKTQFDRYMDAVAVNILPKIEWDNDLDHTTRIGSFFCGGNIGSMTYAGVAKTGTNNFFEFPAGITITEKIVAGCNNANIAAVGNLNAAYEGGLIGESESETNDKVRIKVLSRLEPSLSAEAVSYQDAEGTINESKIYQGANVYGGCYQSGVVNGNVVIDIESDIMAPNLDSNILTATGDYIDASALAIYGGGYGADAVIKGDTKINLTNDARVLFVFGGGEMGEVKGNTTVNLANNLDITGGVQNAYKVYAGGYAGPVDGNTTLNLLGGSVMSAFAGACNADIGGTTEAIIGEGTHGVPYVTHAVYGGNDFGGTIGGANAASKLYNITVPDGTKNVRTQTYVKYVSGKIGRAIYGGSYGSYEYNNTEVYGPLTKHTYPTINTAITAQQNDPDGTILTNTFVDIASTSNSSEDVIGSENSESVLTMLAGGGRGYKGLPQHVEVRQTYLLLHGASYAYRNNQLMAHRVYGGGNLSKVGSTRIDAYSGSFGQIFGGTHGVKTEAAGDLDASYDCGDTKINYYGGMDKADMNLYGTGANSGATGTATINLYGGKVNNVYGGSLAEGYTANTVVNVPETSSNLQANALFGGALGEDEGRPCDVGISNVTFASTTATVEDGIYGGNHTARATKQTNVTISVPVKSQSEILQNIFGAGYGAGTVAGSTHVTLNAGAEVANVYGGGREGRVYNEYKYSTVAGYTDNARQSTWEISNYAHNTLVEINGTSEKIARVTGNVYGAGLGEVANTCGKTKVRLLGGTVDGDIYGGGYAGTMLSLDDAIEYDENIGTLCAIEGGQVRNVFGGGYQGKIEGNSGVSIGTTDGTSFFDGVPTILRSAYGGGEMAVVTGTSTVDMYNGYIGYRYDATSTATKEEDKYQPELKLNNDDEANLLSENGNLYGAGFGEGAKVMNTQVNLYGGTIRNGLYGGGEIAAVGDGTYNTTTKEYTVNQGGQTNVYMYGGLVVGDVFGGGRGYSYDLTGNQIVGKTLYSDGYVFGKTNVEIYRGTIGTDESLALGHGNVFGGGNIGYVYSAGVKYTGETDGTKIKGHYYTNDIFTDRTEDCRVHIAAGALVTADDGVTINNHSYSKGQLVPNADLNTLTYNADYPGAWSSLDNEGVTIRNAVFAGGNVSAGSDKVYANAVTVFGNATAAVVDVFSRDLVTLGGEHVGGLYGDGNLTFVDGYRELNITNYGTDYYHLIKEIETEDELKKLHPREQAYYTYDNTNKKWVINSTSGRTMNTIQRADFCGVFGSRFLLHGAQDRVPDEVDYTNYTINRVGEVSLNTKRVNSTTHGNYFGIYNVVNELGALTSNVEFTSNRQAECYKETAGDNATEDSENYIPGTTYSDFKFKNLDKGFRNNAKSDNMVALASGVYLELLYTDPDTNEKKYGPITGVIQLDLLNVTTGEGGGYVYAKNEHGTPSVNGAKTHLTLSDANEGAITQKAFTYTPVNDFANGVMQTSGNFVHPDKDKRIVDDCFNNDVHFWYVAGNIYIYDQKISAYTGTARSYEQSVSIPFSGGKIKIEEVGMSKYFVGAKGVTELTLGNKTYRKGDIISYWDWSQIEKNVSTQDKGYQNYFIDPIYVTEDGEIAQNKEDNYSIANEMSHEKGYMLTFGMSNPEAWKVQNPSITCNIPGVYGQRNYEIDDLVGKTVYDEQNNIGQHASIDQATFESAYVAIEDVTIDGNFYTKGSHISQDAYNALSTENKNKFDEAYICINTLELNETEYIFINDLISEAEYNDLLDVTQKTHFSPAYVCTSAGKYGGKYIEKDNKLTALDFCKLSNDDRNIEGAFTFDMNSALDLFVFDNYNYGSTYKTEQELEDAKSIETSTLYVPRESDIQNLSKDRIISVVLTYTPKNGENYETDKAEKHIVNIHVEFKTGLPIIGDVNAPAPVLPNTTVGLSVPSVIPGAYEIIGGGWEMYRSKEEAESHKNGMPYLNNATPMYWYQNGYYVAYYAKTYLGKAYSTPVPFTIANYHRLSELMNHKVGDKNEYMYIDHEHASRDRAPKIYMDKAEELELLSQLYNKTLQESELENTVKGCANLDFILRDNIQVTKEWNSIGTQDQCFAGTLHGNGYTISGLSNSLFGKLCGSVYNLGVTGSFTGGGIADNGGDTSGGYVENCWAYTTGTPDANTAALIGTGGSVVNSYYHESNNYNSGTAIKKSAAEFAKGEVAYLLNGYHINKNSDDNNTSNYVKDYYEDGDFIYANGTIPLNTDERYDKDSKKYIPIDDDYIFFGQRLTYVDETHGNLPSRINKIVTDQGSEHIDRTEGNSNRVYRASAYYMNSTESDIFFNTDAKFVDTYDSKPIHHNLTAIDFTGSMKDMEQLLGFSLGDGLTKNLLVYASEEDNGNQYGYNIISSYLNETALTISTDNYQTVAKNTSPSRGHLVTKQGDDYVALTDHFLVDKENFNVPIAYKFDSDKHMWYQREPDRFAAAGNGNGDGWDIICLPFTANLVTTHQKGEITHFYQGSPTMHEYWLRELQEVSTTTSDDQTSTTTAAFASPAAVEDNSYTRDNDFLSDYYYSKYDDNNDTYQDYYKNSETFAGYAYLQANKPYIIAFPGESYHEFDMSGNFEPKNTATSIDKLNKQMVTFVSKDGATIGVTDKNVCKRTAANYDFVGTYQTNNINGYLINDDGSTFVKAGNNQSSVPFRGYLTTTASGAPKRIFISGATEEVEEPAEEVIERGLTIYGKNQAIYIESTLEHEATLTIFTMSGQLVKEVTVQPMSKEVVTVTSRGIYLVNNRKVAVL